MLIGKNARRLSHNLIISKYFVEENAEIQNQYFLRNIADELSVVSLGFGGFFVVINPCSFAIEYSSDTFKDLGDINLVEVEKFEAKAATVFRIEGQKVMPKFDFDYIEKQLTAEQRAELQAMIELATGVNDQYSIEQGVLSTSFDAIELDPKALDAANYKHLDDHQYTAKVTEQQAEDLAVEIAKRKQELEQINHELEIQVEKVAQATIDLQPTVAKVLTEIDSPITDMSVLKTAAKEKGTSSNPEPFDLEFDMLSKELDKLNDFLAPDELFADLEAQLESEEDNV
ncbi:hypothetical protein RZE82_04735 [Mollicutes bacterium LVI A0039]|nr:hypothetical protein RZE82_04735 [Mollicutes bacterium LVI A0039]